MFPSCSWLTAPRFPLLAGVALLGYLWFRLIDHLRVEWSLNEQYAYGWAVPILCALLMWRRWKRGAKENAEIAKAETLKSDLSVSEDHRPPTSDLRPLTSDSSAFRFPLST